MRQPNLNQNVQPPAPEPQDTNFYTGRFLVTVINDDEPTAALKEILSKKAGMKVAQSGDYNDKASISEAGFGGADAFIYDECGVAVVGADDDMVAAMNQAVPQANYIVEPEEVVFAPVPIKYTQKTQATWGLKQTNVVNSNFSGGGVKVAILDTGMELNHPDFQNRNITHRSFVPNETVDDLNGHGTHCTGTACGYEDQKGKRYGIAHNADIYIGKVLGGPRGRGTDSWIINGIYWAVNAGCDIISMSLGAPVYPGQSYKRAYERVAQYALRNNALVIAAAGNESRRNIGIINPVGSPANCPSIMAVGAIDRHHRMGYFSNGSINPNGQVDIVGPGVDVYSSWKLKKKFNTISGTSMATPHVAGIAALMKEKYPVSSPQRLWQLLTIHARRLNLPSSDVGAGLVQAP